MKLSKRWLLLSTFLLVMLGGSITLNFLLYSRAMKYYAELNQTRLDPLGLREYLDNPSKSLDQQLVRVVFFGDSRAASWISPNITGYEFINRGISSQTSTQVSQRFFNHVRPLKPDLIVIQVGINDLKAIALFPDQKASIIANCQANIKRMVEDSKSLGATVIVTTIFPVGEVPLERRPVWSDAIAEAVKEVNAYIATLADDQVIVFDAFFMLVDGQGKMVRTYEVDELHLNPQGYAVLNQELVKQVQAVKQRRVGK